MKKWLVPISGQRPIKHPVAHYMDISIDYATGHATLVTTACGKMVNPAYAKGGGKHCARCKAAIMRISELIT